MNGTDLSLAQRLGIGFAFFFIVIAAMISLFFVWHAESTRAQARYSEHIAPLRDRLAALERSVYVTGIRVRSLLLSSSPERAGEFAESASSVRANIDALSAVTREPDERKNYVQIAKTAEAFLTAAERLAAERTRAPHSEWPASLDDLSGLRDDFLGATAQFGLELERSGNESLAQITAIRERVSRSLIGMAILTPLILGVLGWATVRSVSVPARELLQTAGALEAGDWRPALRLAPTTSSQPRDEMRRLANAIGSAAVALERRQQRLSSDGLVATAVASTLEREHLIANALQLIVAHVNAAVAVVYWLPKGSSTLHPVANYAIADRVAPINVGVGVPGQAARDRKIVLMSDIPADAFSVRLGYAQAPAKSVVAVPLVFGETVHGVLVLGSLRAFDADALEFLESSGRQLGIGLHNAASYEEIQSLLADVRASNERIHAQNEELQAQNEEIQAQSEEIQSQSEELQAQHEELHAQNEELTQQSNELRSHAAALIEADERKNRFLGVLAHELRNPMAPITNSLVILKRSPPGSDSAQRAQAIIERQTMHMVRLIDDLLDVTRITEGKIHLQRERVDLIEIVRTCVEDMGPAFEQAQISLQKDLPDAPVEVGGDRTRLHQILGNLLNNSIKFNNAGGQVSLSVRVDHASGSAVLRVQDNGIGLEPELLTRLFQPFSQGNSGLARTNGGLGLGLALVKALVQLHGGSVQCHSDGPGCGAEFTLRLPLASADEALQREHATPATGQPVDPPAVKRILLIEDHLDAALSLRDALELDGYEVAVAHSGIEGVQLAGTFRPDVVVCDIGLPGMDGYQVARDLRADPRTDSAILIALTGYASAADQVEARAAGFDAHIAKPLRAGGLAQAIHTISRGVASPG